MGGDSCECLTWYDECEMWALKDKTVRGRKSYRCECCGGLILKGEPHDMVQFAEAGIIYPAHRMHTCCHKLLKGAAALYGTGWTYGCNIMGCLEGWLAEWDASNPRHKELISLASQVMERSA